MSGSLVSIVVVTYNHVEYIEQCVQSIINQNTTFKFEILIGEDNSSDGTREKCVELSLKYPNQIKLFLRDRKDVIFINGRPTGRYNFLETISSARGRYVALCDGDDLWSDNLKLQKQFDFLEANEGYSAVVHRVTYLNESNREVTDQVFPEKYRNELDKIALAEEGCLPKTSSLFFRSSALTDIPEWFRSCPTGDYPLMLILSQYGKFKVLPDIMSVYRIHNGGIWSSQKSFNQANLMLEGILTYLRADLDAQTKHGLRSQFLRHFHFLIVDVLYSNSNDAQSISLILSKIPQQDPLNSMLLSHLVADVIGELKGSRIFKLTNTLKSIRKLF